MTTRKLSLANLSDADKAQLVAQIKADEERAAVERKAAREKGKALTSDIVTMVTTSEVPRQTFTSGAEGWSLGGSKFVGADGNTYRVSVLLRDEATIPEKE